MGLFDTLRASLAPTLRQFTGEVGVQVAIYRATEGDASDAQTTRTYAIDATWSSVGAFFQPELPAGAVLSPYGARTTANATLRFIRTASNTLPSVSVFDGFKVLTGVYAGYTFLAAADGAPDTMGLAELVPLTSAPVGVIP